MIVFAFVFCVVRISKRFVRGRQGNVCIHAHLKHIKG